MKKKAAKKSPKIDMKLLAEFVGEGLYGLGVVDDTDEIIGGAFDDAGPKEARKSFDRYNNAIRFHNSLVKRGKITPISEQDYKVYTTPRRKDERCTCPVHSQG